jgi:iron(III)-enterobactin esterase
MSCRPIVRQVQLKTQAAGKVCVGRALAVKPSGCVIWIGLELDGKSSQRFWEFFAANIRNRDTRRAYYIAACRWTTFCGGRGGQGADRRAVCVGPARATWWIPCTMFSPEEPEMKLAIGLFLIAQFALAQVPSAAAGPCEPAPQARPPAAAATKRAPAEVVPATPEDLAEMSKLPGLPVWRPGAGDGDYSIGPDYAPAPEQTKRAGVPEGKVVEFVMNSAESKFYPGVNGPFQRHVCVYVPAQYVPGTAAPFIVSADAYGMRYGLPTILDNMIADHRLPVMVAVMIANGGAERSMEYDTVSVKYADFVEAEVLPRVEKEANVKLTKDPEGRMTFGGSSGGAVSLTMAWFKPELYHRVLTYSGTYTNLQNGPDAPHGAWEYHEHFIPNNPAKPLRVWMEVGENDIGANSASSNYRNWVIANQRMAAVMKTKGYHYQFVYAKNAGHVDARVVNQTLPQALEFLWKGYPIRK